MDHTLVWDQEEALKDIMYTVNLFYPVLSGERRVKVVALICHDGTEFIGDTVEWFRKKRLVGICRMLIRSMLSEEADIDSDFGMDSDSE